MLLFNSTKYSVYLLYLLAIPIISCIDQILGVWLKVVPDFTNIFSVLIICYSFICVVHAPLWDVALASGNIKRYQVVGSCIFLLVFPISYVFLKLGYPPTIVFYVMIGVRICFYISSVIIVQTIANFSLWDYFNRIFTPVVVVVVLDCSCIWVRQKGKLVSTKRQLWLVFSAPEGPGFDKRASSSFDKTADG